MTQPRMEARVKRLEEMIPVHREREADALDRAAKLERLMDCRDGVLDKLDIEMSHKAELQRARTEANTCTLYKHCISQWKSR